MPPIQSVKALYDTSDPSPLGDVIAQVAGLFSAIGNATPIMIGKRYLKSGAGSDARVLFVPEAGNGRLGPPIEAGHAWSVTSSCKVYVRAAESGDDVDRFKSAYALLSLTLAAIRRAGAGRLEGGAVTDASPTDDDAFGADISFEFTYQWDVRQSGAINAVATSAPRGTALVPGIPPGVPASQVNIDPTTTPVEN